MRHSIRRGFTLIELLVVIGIILVLLAIVVVGLRHVNSTAARHETDVELKLCMDLLKEYENVNGLKNIEGAPPTVTPAPQLTLPNPPWLNRIFSLPVYIDPVSPNPEVLGAGVQPASALATASFAGGVLPTQSATAGAAGDMGDKSDADMPRWTCDAVRSTQGIMFILLKDPKNRATLSNLPPNRILETPPPANANDQPPAHFTLDAPVPLDGWGNPIIFVPRGGLHVMMNPTGSSNGPNEYIVRTSGTYLLISPTGIPPVGPADHPFFASAGQDGYFTDLHSKTDRASDNVYSFQEQ